VRSITQATAPAATAAAAMSSRRHQPSDAPNPMANEPPIGRAT